MKKKLCSILLSLTMVLTLLPVSAMADVADTQSATSLPAADENGVITLTENVELTNGLNYTKDVTIVLNGHTITRTNGQKTALMITNGATMTIDGSVAGSAINGTIVVGYSTPSVTNGKLIINGGTYTATVTDDCVVQTNGLCDIAKSLQQTQHSIALMILSTWLAMVLIDSKTVKSTAIPAFI